MNNRTMSRWRTPTFLWDLRDLHIAHEALERRWYHHGLSVRQLDLLVAVQMELGRRSYRTPPRHRCSCMWCGQALAVFLEGAPPWL